MALAQDGGEVEEARGQEGIRRWACSWIERCTRCGWTLPFLLAIPGAHVVEGASSLWTEHMWVVLQPYVIENYNPPISIRLCVAFE